MTRPLAKYLTDAVIIIALIALILALAFGVGGCSLFRAALPAYSIPRPPVGGDNAAAYPVILYAAGLCLLFGVGSLVLRTILPVIPVKSSVVAVLCAVGLWMLHYTLANYMGAMVLAAFGAGAVATAPIVIAWVRLNLKRTSAALARDGDARAATALRVCAEPGKYKNKAKRKALLASMEGS